MKFKDFLYLEQIETLDQSYQRLSDVINASPDYNSAINSLVKMGMETPGNNLGTPIGSVLAKHLYKLIAHPRTANDDPKIDQELESLVQQISQINNIKKLDVDETNKWNAFNIASTNDKSNSKIYLKVNTGEIMKIVKFIISQPNSFWQFKFSYNSKSFISRRDNMVLYLSTQGEKDINNIRQSLRSLGIESDATKDFKTEKGLLTGSDIISHKLAALILKKPGAPAARWYRGAASEFINSENQPKSIPTETSQQRTANYRIVLSGQQGSPLTFGIPTSVGSNLLKFSDSNYYGEEQFRLEKDNNYWYIVPLPNPNATLVNNKPIREKSVVKNGDVISVGNPAKGTSRGPMKVSFQ